MRTRRMMSALAGSLILVGTLIEGYFQSFGFYQEHYLWQNEKYGASVPLRPQDTLFLSVFWVVALGLIYLSYRLMRYALRSDGAASVVSARAE